MIHIGYMEPTFTQKIEPQPVQSSCPMNFSFKKVLAMLGVVLVILILWQWISSPMIVTVTVIGDVSVPATNATVTTTVSANSDSAQGAISAVKSRAEAIKTILTGSGVAESDISESQITSYPASLASAGSLGYQAALQIVAKTSHVSTVGDLVASLYASGASLVNQPVLSVENQSDLEIKAADVAVKDAKSQISKIALKNFKFIRKIVFLDIQTSSTTSTSSSKADTLTQSQNQLAAQNGVFKIAKSASVTYKLW